MGIGRNAVRVSIPFIAGQWSLRSPAWGAWPTPARFNPLHCGAVVASYSSCVVVGRHARFQSPSLRGSGRFRRRCPRSSPLAGRFQSPSLRGSGRFENHVRRGGAGSARFNPLHCGAVVASSLRSRLLLRDCARFNPLHCGAVVASRRLVPGRSVSLPVSIPFIAGQWSLPVRKDRPSRECVVFQSPSLRGSGRFMRTILLASAWDGCFNPLHCGAVVASPTRGVRPLAGRRGFNPLHCGAVVASSKGIR